MPRNKTMLNKLPVCPACGKRKDLKTGEPGTSVSRYADILICSDCGVREAMEGNFWNGTIRQPGSLHPDVAGVKLK